MIHPKELASMSPGGEWVVAAMRVFHL